MTRLNIHTPDTAPQAARPLVARALAANGYLPNLIGVLAGEPLALEAYFTLGEINGRGGFSTAQRETVQITAARLHGCDFCVAGHSALALKKAGLPAAQVVALQQGQHTGDPALDALAAFTAAIVQHRGAVPDEALEAFLAAGHTQAQALETVLGVSLATLCNFANVLAQSPINAQLLPYSSGVLKAA